MAKFNKTNLIAFLILFLSLTINAQQFNGNAGLWSDVGEKQIPKAGTRHIIPAKYRTIKLNLSTLHEILNVAPMEFTPVAQLTKTYLELPMPDGTMETFDIIESPVMAPELAAQFPEINTYAGYAVGDQGKYLRFDFTPQGFHAMILVAGGKTVFIDPYSFGGGDIEHYISYYKKDFVTDKRRECAVTEYLDENKSAPSPNLKSAYGSCELRTYRLALACTGEYAQFHGGTVAGALAAQVTSMNRVNGLYEKDMAIRMNIIANNNVLIYLNAATDPYTNNNGGTMLNENQTNVTNLIGGANYDIGHVYSTGGGGIAQLGSVCNATGKARGVTGSPAPVGDPFDIDYVAHEMGHQFGANHTQNNNCNRNGATAMEPGSASTIMGYAGICAPDVQSNSDDYFHNISLQEIGAFITGAGHTCPVKTTLSNSNPAVTVPNATVNIPRSTPFSLTAVGTDPNASNVLTYCWEQMNNQTSTQPPVATATGGPNFRTFDPTTNPTRYFPNLTALAAGGPFTWEVLPSVTRTMSFRVAVRDNAPGGGCTASANVSVAVDGNSGPFEVTYPTAAGITWAGNSNQTVTWNVSGTTNNPVSCANVDILLSTDGGQTYTVILANTPNDGTQAITVPNTPSTTCRIMVRCSNGYFFDISNNNFTITGATFDYTLSVTNTVVSVCQPSNGVFNINIGSIGGYNTPVNLTLSGLPAGATSNFSSTSVTPVGTSVLTIGNIAGVAPGTYQMVLTGTSTSGTKTVDLTLIVSSTTPTSTTLQTPANAAIGINSPVNFTWTTVAGSGVSYIYELATDAAFSNIIQSATVTVTNYSPTVTLANATTYYWRVTAVTGCGTAPASSTFSFTTSSCNIYTSTDVPKTISANGIVTVNSVLSVPTAGTITDVNVTNLVGTHTYVQDLVFRLRSPANTTVTLARRPCGDNDNFNIKFDDAAASATLPCPLTDGNYYRPAGLLSAYNGQNQSGTWTLTIIDSANVDGGSLTAWSIQVCVSAPAPCVLTTNTTTQTNVSCFGNANGSATVTGTGGTTPYTYSWSNGRTTSANTGLAAGTYTVTVADASGCSGVRTVTITQPSSALSATTSSSNISCNGGNNGSINTTTSGGTANYTYSWSNGRTTANVSGLAAGSYRVTISDANGCSVTQSVILTQPSALSIFPATPSNVSCFGGTNGSSSVTTGGTGVGPYTFLWSNGSTSQILSNVSAGTYNLTLTDANNCTATSTVTISQPASAVNIQTSAISNVLCFGASTGSISTSTTGGTPAYSYVWSSGQNTQNINGLAAGTYTLTASDNNGCNAVSSFTVTQSSDIIASINSVGMSCALNDGSLTATISGGVAPYGILWSNGANTTINSNLNAGNYNYTITDANGCQKTGAASVSNNCTACAVTSNVNSNNISCNALCNGNISITPTNGSAPYNFSWSDNGTGPIRNNLCAGIYTVTISDNSGCQGTQSVTLTQPSSALNPILSTPTNVTCFGGNNGSVSATATGGTQPYSFLWSNNSTTQSQNNLTAGNYSVTVTDANGCAAVQNATISQPTSGLNLSSSVSSNVTCFGGNDGSATLTVSGGSSPYTFSWSNNSNNQNLSNVVAGNYIVTVIDANGCNSTSSVNISQPASFTAQSNVTSNVTCFGANNGSVSLTVNGGSAPFSFNWSNNSTNQNQTNLSAGNYTVTVTDANGCNAISTALISGPSSALSVNASSTSTNCINSSGVATAIANGGTGNVTYLWSNGANTASISGLNSGNYSVTVTDANGCISTANTVVNISGSLSISPISTNPSCNGLQDGLIELNLSGNSTPQSFNWSNGANTQNISGLSGGVYSVTVTAANGCVSSTTVTLQQPAVLSASAIASDPSSASSNDGTIDLSVNGGTAPYTYSWSNGANTQDLLGLSAGNYIVTVTDANGCTFVENVNLVSSISLFESLENFNLMPNPNQGNFQINIDFNLPQNFNLKLVDVLGRTLREWNYNQELQIRVPVNISEQASGIYFVVLSTEKGNVKTLKITKSE